MKHTIYMDNAVSFETVLSFWRLQGKVDRYTRDPEANVALRARMGKALQIREKIETITNQALCEALGVGPHGGDSDISGAAR